ncbi:putative dipeptidyl-aminopeptidase B [Armadillidium vulgare]|nr:putative dipeptidyl-aminopeptidase B [Armadillidium vulgare]
MLFPPEVIENEGVQHPTIIFVSGVPGEQVVNYKWGADFATYLASNKSWVVVLMDVRGSGGEELSREYQPAWNLGHYEALDHLSIANEKFMGTARVVPGGNFRGYEDSTLLRRGMDYFNKSLYIIHGSADTDVLYSHTLKFSKELIREGVLFRNVEMYRQTNERSAKLFSH